MFLYIFLNIRNDFPVVKCNCRSIAGKQGVIYTDSYPDGMERFVYYFINVSDFKYIFYFIYACDGSVLMYLGTGSS